MLDMLRNCFGEGGSLWQDEAEQRLLLFLVVNEATRNSDPVFMAHSTRLQYSPPLIPGLKA